MAIFAEHRARSRDHRNGRVAGAIALFALAGGNTLPAVADTTGGAGSTIPGPNPLPGTPSNPPPIWGHIENEHILVSIGYINTMAIGGVTLGVPGRISFGTVQGSRASTSDNNKPLAGFDFFGIYPYGHSFFGNIGAFVALDYPAYLRAIVDGTQFNVGYDAAKTLSPPFFRRLADGPVLGAQYLVGTNDVIQIEQNIKLLRSTARIEWKITNTDTVAHNVGLRFTVNQRSKDSGFYFVDPDRGATQQISIYEGTRIPSEMNIFARRAEQDINDPTLWPFHSRHVFRGAGATEPSRVYVGDPIDLYPGEAAAPVDGYTAQPTRLTFESGIAVATYFGGDNGYVVRPGETRTVVTYYGLGTSSETFGNDVVLGTEAPSSLQFNSGAALDAAVAGNTSAMLATVAPKYLTPNPFQIFASAYSQKSSDPEFEVTFRGAQLSLTLPSGLRFAKVPGTNTLDTATKLVDSPGGSGSGVIAGDQEGTASWWVEPTGDRFGPLTYQVSLSATSPSSISRTVSRSINVPVVPLVELVPSTFQMIGFPFSFDPILSNQGNPDTVINTLTRPQELNPIFYQWQPDPDSIDGTTGRWAIVNQLKTGVAYFYRPSVQTGPGKRLIVAKGVVPTSTQAPLEGVRSVPTQIRVERGWNMISNPYVYDIPLKYLRIISLENNPDLRSVSFSEAVQTGLMRGSTFFYNPVSGGYDFFTDLNQALRPWQGYWIYMNTSAEIQFVPPTLRNSLVVPSSAGEPATRKMMTADDWKLQVVARRNDGREDGATYLGVTPTAKESNTTPKPPAFQDYVQVGLLNPQGQGRYAQMLRTPNAVKTWDLVVESDKDGDVVLRWPGIANLPKRVRLSITDLQTNVRLDLRSVPSLKIAVRKGGVSRLRVSAQTEATSRLAVSYLRPEGGGSRSGSYAYRLGVTQNATVDARVVTFSGRTIQSLASGRAAGPSGTRLIWNGRNADGSPVPAGTYHLEVTVTGEDGTIVRDIKPVTVIR